MNKAHTPISCLPVSLFQDFFNRTMTILDWASYASQLGMDYIDMNRRCLLNMTVGQAKQEREKLAVPVMMVTRYSDFTNPDANGLRTAIEDAKNDIKPSASIDAKYIRLTDGQGHPNQAEREMIDRIYHCFEECLPVAEEAGIRLLLENHSKPGAWQYPDFDFKFDRMLMLWEKVKARPVGVNFDTANGYAVGNWRALVDVLSCYKEARHVTEMLKSLYWNLYTPYENQEVEQEMDTATSNSSMFWANRSANWFCGSLMAKTGWRMKSV